MGIPKPMARSGVMLAVAVLLTAMSALVVALPTEDQVVPEAASSSGAADGVVPETSLNGLSTHARVHSKDFWDDVFDPETWFEDPTPSPTPAPSEEPTPEPAPVPAPAGSGSGAGSAEFLPRASVTTTVASKLFQELGPDGMIWQQ